MVELTVHDGSSAHMPVVAEGLTWTTERRGAPGKLEFTVVKGSGISFSEGAPVRLVVGGVRMFYGFVFAKKRDKRQHVTVTAYDQLRYLLNKDTYVMRNYTATDLVRRIAGDFGLNLGKLDETTYRIEAKVEDNVALMDMVYGALDQDLMNTRRMHVLYDDFGALTLRSIDGMVVDALIDEESGENFEYSSSIDETYNRVKLAYENEETGKRDIYIAQSSDRMNAWGVLQHYDTLAEGENGQSKADALLELMNVKVRRLKVLKVFGDPRVRAGSMVMVRLKLGDIRVNHLMMVERCVHAFALDDHRMDLTLRGEEFV